MWINLSPLQNLPPIRRVRGDRWYDDRGRHWVDFWKDGGAWLFGHKSHGARLEWKNQVDKGLSSLVPTNAAARLKRHVNALFPRAKELFVFRNPERALLFLERICGRELGYRDWESIAWRPWEDLERTPCEGLESWTWPILPSGPTQARILISTREIPSDPENASDLVPALDLAAMTRAAIELTPGESTTKTLDAWSLVWRSFDRTASGSPIETLWKRSGPYLNYVGDLASYDDVFRHFCDSGFVLSPDPSQPSILPQALSYGELDRFRKAAHSLMSEE